MAILVVTAVVVGRVVMNGVVVVVVVVVVVLMLIWSYSNHGVSCGATSERGEEKCKAWWNFSGATSFFQNLIKNLKIKRVEVFRLSSFSVDFLAIFRIETQEINGTFFRIETRVKLGESAGSRWQIFLGSIRYSEYMIFYILHSTFLGSTRYSSCMIFST